MARSYSWYHAARHATYKKNDVLKFTGAYYKSADGEKKYGTHSNTSRYFNSYYTNSNWEVLAPICFGYAKDQMWAYAKPSTIVSGGTLDTYTIKYNANGGTGAPSNQTKTYGKALTLRTRVPTRAGHNFVCWNRKADGSGDTNFKPGGNYTGNQDTTFYAIWSPYTHTVKYEANGGSGVPNRQTKKYGGTIFISGVTPTRTGHDFLYWNTEPDSTGTTYKSGQEYGYDQNGGTVVLYAIWKPHTYEVKYEANGGSNAPSNQTKTYGKDLTLRTTEPTRPNHTFLGWGTTSASTTVAYKAGGTYKENKAITLYAIWKLNSYNITYELNGGTNNSSNKKSCVIGTALTLYTPTKVGYSFVGWHLNSASGAIVTEIPSTNTEDIKLYAEWKLKQFKITIDPNGGVYNGSTTKPAVYAYYGNTITLQTPTKEGHEFLAWNVSGAGGFISENTFKVGEGNCSITAIWDLDLILVNYDTQGGELGEHTTGYIPEPENGTMTVPAISRGGSYCTVVYQYGDDISEYIIPSATKENYSFLGWYTHPEEGELIVSPYTVTKNMTLYAHWEVQRTACVFSEKSFIDGIAFVKDDTKTTLPKGVMYVFKDGKFIKGGEI